MKTKSLSRLGFTVLITFFSLLAAPAIAQETCGTDPATSPNHSDNYILGSGSTDGMAMHWASGLVWNRCSEGQSWDGSACTGTETFKPWNDWMADYLPRDWADLEDWWTSTLGYTPPAQPVNPPNRLLTGDWRMPYRQEILALTTGCADDPKINRGVFPNTASSVFWSASPHASLSSYARNVRFIDGNYSYFNRSNSVQIRAVRGGQSFADLTAPAPRSAAAGSTETFDALDLAASDDAAGNQAWGGARIEGEGSPEFELNGDGQWVTEAIVKSGDSIRVRLTAGADGSERTATLYLRSGETEGTADDGSNGGDEDTTKAETTADFTVQVVAATHTVTASVSGGNGSITPATQNVNDGDSASFTVTPDTGYHLDSISGDTCTVTGSGSSYSADNLQEDCAVTASFAINTYTVTASVSGGNGSITPATQSVDYGDSASFIVTPDAGYEVDTVSGDTCTVTGSGSSYGADSITADCAVTASFAKQAAGPATPVAVPAMGPRGLLLLIGLIGLISWQVRRT